MNNSVENSEWQKQVCNYQEKKKNINSSNIGVGRKVKQEQTNISDSEQFSWNFYYGFKL